MNRAEKRVIAAAEAWVWVITEGARCCPDGVDDWNQRTLRARMELEAAVRDLQERRRAC